VRNSTFSVVAQAFTIFLLQLVHWAIDREFCLSKVIVTCLNSKENHFISNPATFTMPVPEYPSTYHMVLLHSVI
jgi:hypothetical protein